MSTKVIICPGYIDIGMVSLANNSHLSCSPDGATVICANGEGTEVLSGDNDFIFDGKCYWIASVEIKTRVATTALCYTLSLTRFDSICCEV